jgi:Ca-activated chloride channel homolog
MPESGFHFSQPWWLLGLLLILPVAMWLRRSCVYGRNAKLNRYADPQLLPHLTGSRELQPRERQRRFLRWALLWTALILAMAGPRWDYQEVQLFTPGVDLVVVVDISRSMEVADAQPSRLARARQEVEDLITLNPGVRIGLIAFATVAHVIAPITEDGASIRAKLPHLSSDLAKLQGSNLGEALERARLLVAGQPKEGGRHVLLITDGDFMELGLEERVRTLAESGIHVHVLGVGALEGGPVPAAGPRGGWMIDKRTQKVVQSRLGEAELQHIAGVGRGLYQQADYRDTDTRRILDAITKGSKAAAADRERAYVWNERFHWLLIPALLALLPGFRRLVTREEEQGHV